MLDIGKKGLILTFKKQVNQEALVCKLYQEL